MIRLIVVCLLFAACAPDKPGCLDSAKDTCVPAAPCDALTFDACEDATVTAFVVSSSSERPPGLDGAAGQGDFVLKNAHVTAVIDAPDHPTQLAISGGQLLDLAPTGGDDHLNQVSHVTGILPRDAVKYTEVKIGEVTAERATVIARGTLYGEDRVQVVTRYELRPCDRGIRMRTELYNGSRVPQGVYLADAFFWGDRGVTPFVPLVDEGFAHPPLDLVEIDLAFRNFPFMSAQSHVDDPGIDASYATVACDRRALSGINTRVLSAAGTTRTVVVPGDGLAFERVLLTAAGKGSAPAQKLALDVRSRLFQEPYVKVKGSARFTERTVPLGSERELSLLFVEESAEGEIPWAEVVPDDEGAYELFLPSNKRYKVKVFSYGQEIVPPQVLELADFDESFVLQNLPRPGRLEVFVRELPQRELLDAELVLVPVDGAAGCNGSLYGVFGECNPYLGPPHGNSPACNRALAPKGEARFQVPPGEYWIYATHGPHYTLARQRIKVEAGGFQRVEFELQPLPTLPAGTLDADFHVHGGRSFDTTIPDDDRVVALLASGIKVIAATDHDVVGSYEAELARQGAQSKIYQIPATELTQLILFYHRDGSSVPRTQGHFNFWPMTYDPLMPRNGAPYDESVEPNELYELMRGLTGPDGVNQLNHPYAESLLGRDEGYATAIGYDPRKKITEQPNASPEGQWRKKSKSGRTDNLGHDAQEVMNGASIGNFLSYRQLWLSFLKQGILRAGTANSDSHTMNIEQVGYPRNIVLGSHSFPDVDLPALNAAVRKGEMIGTNGPIIEVSIRDAAGVDRGPSIEPFTPAAAARFSVSVKAAPWIPVTELRVYKNGELVQTVPMSVMSVADPFGTEGVVRYTGEIALADVLTTDGFVHFEAGLALPEAKDLVNEDGVYDTMDFDGDGDVDMADHDLDTHVFPPQRATESDPRFHIDVVSPRTWPTAFTNPFIIDFAGDGWEAPGL